MSKSLLHREIDRGRAASSRLVIEWLEDRSAVAASPHHSVRNARKVARRLKRSIRSRRNPALLNNGGKS